MNELAGRGRLVLETVRRGGNARVAELEERHRVGDVLESMLAELPQLDRPSSWLRVARVTTTWPPWAAAATRAARWTSSPT